MCSSNLPHLQLVYCTFICVHPIYLTYSWIIVHLYVVSQFTSSTAGALHIYMCSSNLSDLQLEYSTCICVQPIYLIYNWRIRHLFVLSQLALSRTGVLYIHICFTNETTWPTIVLEYSTFICVEPIYLIYNWSIVNLHVFHCTLSTTGVNTCICVQPMYLMYIFIFFVDTRLLRSRSSIQWLIDNGTRSHI